MFAVTFTAHEAVMPSPLDCRCVLNIKYSSIHPIHHV